MRTKVIKKKKTKEKNKNNLVCSLLFCISVFLNTLFFNYWCPLKLPLSRARMCVCVFLINQG